jgi:hypothetical protein
MSFRIENCECNYETKKAIKVESDWFLGISGEIDQWIPRSQIEDDSEVYKKGTDGALIVSDWLAKQKGWQ